MIILKHKLQQKEQVETSIRLNFIKVVPFLCEARALREYQSIYKLVISLLGFGETKGFDSK